MRTVDHLIVGAGAMGCAAAASLARQGAEVLVLERVSPGHLGGSSHGESRAIRLSNFENPAYAPIIRRAVELWRELETQPHEIFLPTGVLECGPPRSELVESTLKAALAGGIAVEKLTAREVRARFPAVTIPPDWIGVFQCDGGLLRPDNAIRRFLETAKARGAGFETTTVIRVEQRGEHVEVETADWTIEAGSVIVTAGAWIADLVPELRPHLELTRQVLGWFEPVQPELVRPDALPVFLFDAPGAPVYGFPDFCGLGVKAASHDHGRVLGSGDDARQDAAPDDLADVRRVLADMLGPAAGRLTQCRTCIYTNTTDQEFVVDRRPGQPRIVFASACSGHGFKFATAIGEALARMALGQQPACDLEAFRLDRPGLNRQ